MSAPNDFTNAAAAAKFLLSQTSLRPKIGLVLGSGLVVGLITLFRWVGRARPA